jgi:hypothetical protein
MRVAPYNRAVFLNCPFDDSYRPIRDAIVFTVYDAGLTPRCSLEFDDATENRIDKIFRMIGQCRFGIHDISRTEIDPVNALPRFNMPLELGIFLGAKRFGGKAQGGKSCLVLGREPYQYQKYLSDVAGQDAHAHHNDPKTAVAEVRGWLRTASGQTTIPGGEEIWSRYLRFQQQLPEIGREMKVRTEEMTFTEFSHAVDGWLRENPLTSPK